MASVPEYTRKAIKKYNDKHDKISLMTPKGTKERFAALNLGISFSAFARNCVLEKLDQLENENSSQATENEIECPF